MAVIANNNIPYPYLASPNALLAANDNQVPRQMHYSTLTAGMPSDSFQHKAITGAASTYSTLFPVIQGAMSAAGADPRASRTQKVKRGVSGTANGIAFQQMLKGTQFLKQKLIRDYPKIAEIAGDHPLVFGGVFGIPAYFASSWVGNLAETGSNKLFDKADAEGQMTQKINKAANTDAGKTFGRLWKPAAKGLRSNVFFYGILGVAALATYKVLKETVLFGRAFDKARAEHPDASSNDMLLAARMNSLMQRDPYQDARKEHPDVNPYQLLVDTYG